MKTLIFIHGGESFTNEQDYQKFLSEAYVSWQSEAWNPELKNNWVQEIAKKWHENGNQVFMPVFPNKQNACYRDWKIVFEGILAKLAPEDEVTLVGGSLGGCFLLKYFSDCFATREDEAIQVSGNTEHGLLRTSQGQSLKINQIHLLAACIECGDFTAPDNYEYLQQVGNRLHIWHAEDDKVVPFATAGEFSRTLPAAQTHFFSSEKGYGHFYGVERIPELEEVIFG